MGAEDKRTDALDQVPASQADLYELEVRVNEKLTVYVLNGDGRKHPKPIGEAFESFMDEAGWVKDVNRAYRLVAKYKWPIIILIIITYQYLSAFGLSLFNKLNVFEFFK
jgi:hypothetical protein